MTRRAPSAIFFRFAAGAAALALTALCAAAIPPPGEKKPRPRPPTQSPYPPPDPSSLPGLDDLLGIPSDKPTPQPGQPDQTGQPDIPVNGPDREALDRALDPNSKEDPFEQAVDLMDRSAVRLTRAKDAGLGTQRIQEEVVRKLDHLIDQAQKQQQQSKSKSRQQQQQQQQTPQQDSQQQSQNDQQKGDNQGQTHVPGRQDGDRKDRGAPNTAAWGNLPEHVRDALLQGFSDRFSSLYQSMTEAYYRKLAEEPKK